jgi:hypothetical protein
MLFTRIRPAPAAPATPDLYSVTVGFLSRPPRRALTPGKTIEETLKADKAK